MSVLVFVENTEETFSKSAVEAVYYAGKIAENHQTDLVALTFGNINGDTAASLGNYGAKKVLTTNSEQLKDLDSQVFTKVISDAVEKVDAEVIVFSNNYTTKSIAPRLSAKLKAGLIVDAIDYPTKEGDAYIVKRSVFSGKGYAFTQANTPKLIVSLQSNSFIPEVGSGQAAVEELDVDISGIESKVTVTNVNKASKGIPLTEAAIVVSGGRGMKGAENWPMLEELADILGAALACSRPVSDVDWRPHSEHVGQTGLSIRPDLYIAVGISGAIQHLAGVNGSKNIVVINKDAEAPFFSAANYGIVGDAFEVVPKLIEAFKNNN